MVFDEHGQHNMSPPPDLRLDGLIAQAFDWSIEGIVFRSSTNRIMVRRSSDVRTRRTLTLV